MGEKTPLLDLASNDYLGLSGHPELVAAAKPPSTPTASGPAPPGW